MSVLFGGVEGGASRSRALLITEEGQIISEVEGPYLNIFLIGIPESYKRIKELLNKAFEKLPATSERKLQALGLDLSGAHGDSIEKELLSYVQEQQDPLFPTRIKIMSDALAPIVTCFGDKGGICVIAGTGTNCCLINPDSSVHFCGGWGHLLGDYGGAYWIVSEVLKRAYEVEDGMEGEEAGVDDGVKKVMELAKVHFSLEDRHAILPHLYTNFQKSNIASFAKILAQELSDHGNVVIEKVFHEAGFWLGKHVWAILKKTDPVSAAIGAALMALKVGDGTLLNLDHDTVRDLFFQTNV